MTGRLNPTRLLAAAAWVMVWHCAALADVAQGPAVAVDHSRWAGPGIASLDDLSIDALRARGYASELKVIEQLGTAAGRSRYARHYARQGTKPHDTVLAEYQSDGNRVYTRIDIPSAPRPAQGYPVVIFLHGWYSNEDAPAFDFSYRPGTLYADTIEAYVKAGFVVVYPGWRGYGTVGGRAADGHGFLRTWNDASYLMPMFFAIDVLNLLEGLQTLERTDWSQWGLASARSVSIDPHNIHIAGHSQGGDVVLTVLAAAGEGSSVRTAIASGSIWAGCFPARFQQLETYNPMAATLEAFVSGDGTWNGTATGRNGVVNPNFVFGWPPDWIGTPDPQSRAWTWQAKQWSSPGVAAVLRDKYQEMYDTLNGHVADLGDARFVIEVDERGKATVQHDPRVAAAMPRIGGFGRAEYLSEPLILHFSDRDYYSIPAWNDDLSHRINAAGGRAIAFVYPGNTHSLGKSKQAWFSGKQVVPGYRFMLKRDITLFGGQDPALVRYPPSRDAQ